MAACLRPACPALRPDAPGTREVTPLACTWRRARREINILMQRVLLDDFDQSQMVQTVEADWDIDSHGYDHLDYTRFRLAWFQASSTPILMPPSTPIPIPRASRTWTDFCSPPPPPHHIGIGYCARGGWGAARSRPRRRQECCALPQKHTHAWTNREREKGSQKRARAALILSSNEMGTACPLCSLRTCGRRASVPRSTSRS